MPIFSTIAAARNTAGVQLPQAPMPTITASALCACSLSGIVGGHLVLARAVEVAELLVADELHVRESAALMYSRTSG